MNKERKEALIRIPIAIIFWIIGELWGVLTAVIVILNFIYTIFAGKRNKNLTKFVNSYVTYIYRNIRYLCFTTNERPWPFNKLKDVEKVDYKFQN